MATLDKAMLDGAAMKKTIRGKTDSFDGACQQVSDILRHLTDSVSMLEKVKAKCGLSERFEAHLHLSGHNNDLEDNDADDLLKAGRLTLIIVVGLKLRLLILIVFVCKAAPLCDEG